MDKIKAHPMYQMVAPMILAEAKQGTTPEAMAERIADMVPDMYWDAVVQLVAREPQDMIQYLALFEPELANHGPWLISVADVLKREFIEDTDEVVDEEVDEVSAPSDAVTAGAAPKDGGG